MKKAIKAITAAVIMGMYSILGNIELGNISGLAWDFSLVVLCLILAVIMQMDETRRHKKDPATERTATGVGMKRTKTLRYTKYTQAR